MDADTDSVFVSKCGIQTVNVHPLVLFSILEHHLRRDEEDNRVIGEAGVARVGLCHAVPASPTSTCACPLRVPRRYPGWLRIRQRTGCHELFRCALS